MWLERYFPENPRIEVKSVTAADLSVNGQVRVAQRDYWACDNRATPQAPARVFSDNRAPGPAAGYRRPCENRESDLPERAALLIGVWRWPEIYARRRVRHPIHSHASMGRLTVAAMTGRLASIRRP